MTSEIATMERRLAALGHVVVDYNRFNAMNHDVETLAKARELARSLGPRYADTMCVGTVSEILNLLNGATDTHDDE